MAKVVSVVNRKGGVGKTTSIIEMLYQAGRMGKKTLAVDMDAQANATKMLTGQEWDPSLYDLMIGQRKDLTLRDVLKAASADWPGTLVLPANQQLGLIEPHLLTKMNREGILKNILAPIRDAFDLILIDLPPTINQLTVNALVASDAYIVPCDVSQYARDGVRAVKETADMIRETGNNPNLDFIGIFLTSFQKGGSHAVRALVADLVEEYGDKVLQTRVPDSVKVTESQKLRRPVGAIDPEHPVAMMYAQLVEEIL